MLHDLRGGDAMVGVGCQHALQKVLADVARAARRLVLTGNDSREELLQPHEVVCAVVTALGEGEHRCMHARTARSGTCTKTPALAN